MKKIEPFKCVHVISEPGDCTRYDYYVIHPNRSIDVYFFISYENDFAYPQKLEYVDVCDIYSAYECADLCEGTDVNPHTMIECINTVREIFEKGLL